MSSNNSSRSGGMGIGTVLTIIFVVLKLVGVEPVASWSWLWVLSPLWISFLFSLVILAIAGIAIAAVNASHERNFTNRVVLKSRTGRPGYRGLPNNEKAPNYLGRNY